MKLSEILKGINVKNTYEDCEVTNVTQDSRMIEEGCLFVCIKGGTFDGHSAAREALEKVLPQFLCRLISALTGR